MKRKLFVVSILMLVLTMLPLQVGLAAFWRTVVVKEFGGCGYQREIKDDDNNPEIFTCTGKCYYRVLNDGDVGFHYTVRYHTDVRKNKEFSGNAPWGPNSCEWVITKKATATAHGIKSCWLCGQEQPVHMWIEVPEQAPTCTEVGWTAGHICSVCNKTYDRETIKKLDHDLVYEKRIAPTCTKEGYSGGYRCQREGCKYNTGTPLAKLPHTEEILPAVPATCTSTGLTEGKKCSVCDTVITAQQTIAKLPHTEEILPAVPATCTSTGLTEGKKCSVCDTVITAQQTIEKLPHTEEILPAVPSTYESTGLTEGKRCSVCQTILIAQQETPRKTPAGVEGWDFWYDERGVVWMCNYHDVDYTPSSTAHHTATYTHHCVNDLNADTKTMTDTKDEDCTKDTILQTVPATCVSDGYTLYACSKCLQEIKTDYTSRNDNHDLVDDAAITPTCAQEGRTAGQHCQREGCDYKTWDVLEMLPHTEVIDPAVEPTETTPGKTEGKHCSVCQKVLVAQEIIPATGKKPEHVHEVVNIAAVKATCTKPGKTAGSYCKLCGKELVTPQATRALGHWYGQWKPKMEAFHEAACRRPQCGHTTTVACTWYTALVNGETIRVCPICGAYDGQQIFPMIVNAAGKNVDENAIPQGELIVRGLEAPFGTEAVAIGGLESNAAPVYGLTVAYELGGRENALNGRVKVTVPMMLNEPFTLIFANEDATWTEIPATFSDGMLTFETDHSGLFLLMPAE